MRDAEIDWTQVDELRSDMGDAFDEVVTVFLQEVEGGLADLSPDAGSIPLAEGLHFLKGAALNLGFKSFGDACATAEREARAGNTDAIDLDAIRKLYETSRTEFRAGLDRRAA